MNIVKLIEILKTFPQDMEVVTRIGNNSGAKYVNSISKWNLGPNPNTLSDCQYLLAEMPDGNWFGKDTKEVLVLN